MKRSLWILGLLLPLGLAQADTTWVPQGDAFGDWTAADSPFMIEGNLVVQPGDTLSIGPGVMVNFVGNYDLDVRGKFTALGAIDSLIVFTADTVANPARWRGISMAPPAHPAVLDYCVLENGLMSWEDSDAALFVNGVQVEIRHSTIRNHLVYGQPAVLIDNSGSLTMEDCEISDIATLGGGCGGGLSINHNSSVEMIRSRIIRAASLDGGAICLRTGSLLVMSDCELIDNHASLWAGAIFCSGADLTMERCLIYGNVGGATTGGLQIGGSVTSITRCTFAYNSGVNSDVAYTDAGVVFNSCIFTGHTTAELFYGSPQVEYSCFFNNGTATWPEGEGNFEENPLFVDGSNGDFHLTEDSPCIDTGDPDLPEDPDGTRADIGAFYFHQDTSESTIPAALPVTAELLTVYPNPFNAETALRYSVETTGPVSLRIVDLLGREVAELVHDDFLPGTYSVEWNAAGYASGLYFAVLDVQGDQHVRKIILMK